MYAKVGLWPMILISWAWSYVPKILPDVFCNSMLFRCVQADNCFIELVLDISKVKTWEGKGSISRPSKDEKGFPRNWLSNQTIVKGILNAWMGCICNNQIPKTGVWFQWATQLLWIWTFLKRLPKTVTNSSLLFDVSIILDFLSQRKSFKK